MVCTSCDGTGRIREPGFDGPTMVQCHACAGTGKLTIIHHRAMWASIALELQDERPTLSADILARLTRTPVPQMLGMQPADEASRNAINNAYVRVDGRLRSGVGAKAA